MFTAPQPRDRAYNAAVESPGQTLTAVFSNTFRLLTHNYLYFHRHSGLARAFSTAIFCFHRDSRIVRAEKEFSLRSEVPGGQPARRSVTS
jgi:hypothetical protein